MDLNLAVDNKGSCSGKISPNGVGTVDIAKKGALAYIKGDEQFWRTSLSTYESSKAPPGKADDLIASLQGQWIKATKEMREGMGFDLCDLDKLSGIVSLGMGSGLARGVDATENGQPIAVVYQRKGVRVTTMHVAKTGKPFPVRFLDAGDGMPTDVYLSDFNQPVDVAFPTADQVLDLSKVR
ncbi:hypothetical protein [Streptomyces sp. NPDC058084]|uniref:hypothetical protein n=1 Tax=Streptomyces sp. NPDC058084 TaxID=3346333 RepID=UPI0036E52582